MAEPAPTEVVWPSSAVIDDGSLVLVDGARSRVSLCRCAGGVAVVKRFRGATANRHRDAASRPGATRRRRDFRRGRRPGEATPLLARAAVVRSGELSGGSGGP